MRPTIDIVEALLDIYDKSSSRNKYESLGSAVGTAAQNVRNWQKGQEPKGLYFDALMKCAKLNKVEV